MSEIRMLWKAEELINHLRGMSLGLNSIKKVIYYTGTNFSYDLDGGFKS